MSSQAAPLPPPPERVPYELLDRAQTTRVWLLAGGSLLLAADAAALLGSDLRWVLSFGLAFVGWVVGLGGYLLAPRTQPAQLRPFGTGLLTCVLGGTALGPAARVHAAIASNALLPVPARSRADRAWRVSSRRCGDNDLQRHAGCCVRDGAAVGDAGVKGSQSRTVVLLGTRHRGGFRRFPGCGIQRARCSGVWLHHARSRRLN